jgi:1,4-alpha-glucan branching enzyme
VAPYDAELFGHWWMEGPAFIDAVAREARLRGLGLVSLADPSAWSRGAHVARPAMSSWGEGGHLGVWLDASNAWMQRPLRSMNLRLARWLDAARPSGPAGGRAGDAAAMTRDRCLRQAAREWMLAWASDWPFLIRMNTARAYAEARFRSHVGRFDRLEAMAHGREGIDPSWLGMVEAEDNLFPEIDPASWLGRDEPVQGVGRPPHA